MNEHEYKVTIYTSKSDYSGKFKTDSEDLYDVKMEISNIIDRDAWFELENQMIKSSEIEAFKVAMPTSMKAVPRF